MYINYVECILYGFNTEQFCTILFFGISFKSSLLLNRIHIDSRKRCPIRNILPNGFLMYILEKHATQRPK